LPAAGRSLREIENDDEQRDQDDESHENGHLAAAQRIGVVLWRVERVDVSCPVVTRIGHATNATTATAIWSSLDADVGVESGVVAPAGTAAVIAAEAVGTQASFPNAGPADRPYAGGRED
jgi:hypothetical protein